ncbi:MAG: hypothetical protein AVDCRST_MAG67-516 [uncultured Solirubrobacteraceae bacterium]|uniref:CobQ/CobB/MinD/ParA nucleotide binding domain-containing protein n=1 Tax=uncultured Solirubrobacteraceae bacterium TaxID=1162706 RepID=A0A6J4RM37_9ACTN|nr:MAG: hypothetical protein AVDCRST_MAG67-516 [uncultured Solirubrobacteraceae bacterium]
MRGQQQTSGLLGALRQRALLIVACAVVVASLAYVLSDRQEPRYEATALLNVISDTGPSLPGRQVEATPGEATAGARVSGTGAVAVRAARRAGVALGPASVSATQPEESNVIRVTASAPQPRAAADLANAFAVEFRAERRRRARAVLTRARDSIRRTLASIQTLRGGRERRIALGQRLDDLQLQIDVSTGGLEIADRAVPPAEAVSPRPRRDAMLGGLFGLVLGGALALLWSQADRRVRQLSELQDLSGLPVLGTIPRSRALSGRDALTLPAADAEAFRVVQANTRFFNPGLDVRSVIVTSAAPGEGKTTLAWNLAVAAASGGLRVLLIEADLRKPSLVDRYGLKDNGGLNELLSEGYCEISDVVQHVPIVAGVNGHGPKVGMSVVTAGRNPTNPSGLIASDRMRAIIARAETEHDLVVLDTPPVSVVSDAIPLLRVVGGVIVVSYLGRSTRDGVGALLTQLRHLEVRVLGVVANGGRHGDVYPYQ